MPGTAAARQQQRTEQLQKPTHATVVELLSDEILASLALPGAGNASAFLAGTVAARLKKIYGNCAVPAPVRSGSRLLARWHVLHTKKGKAQHQREVATLKEALRECPTAQLAAAVPVNATIAGEFRPLKSETVSRWVARVNRRIPSLYLSKQNRANKAAKGELKAKRAGAGLLRNAWRKPGRRDKARDSKFATLAVRLKTRNRLTAQRAAQAVRSRAESAHRMCVIVVVGDAVVCRRAMQPS